MRLEYNIETACAIFVCETHRPSHISLSLPVSLSVDTGAKIVFFLLPSNKVNSLTWASELAPKSACNFCDLSNDAVCTQCRGEMLITVNTAASLPEGSRAHQRPCLHLLVTSWVIQHWWSALNTGVNEVFQSCSVTYDGQTFGVNIIL